MGSLFVLMQRRGYFDTFVSALINFPYTQPSPSVCFSSSSPPGLTDPVLQRVILEGYIDNFCLINPV